MTNILESSINNLKKESLQDLFDRFGFNFSEINWNYNTAGLTFDSSNPKAIEELIDKMSAFLQIDFKSQIRNITKAALLRERISKTAANQKACSTLIDAFPLNYVFSDDKSCFSIALPSHEIAALCESVEDDCIKVNLKSNELHFTIKGEYPMLIDGVLYVPSDLFAPRKIFYIEEEINEQEKKITPFVLTPNSIQPPNYIFVLDTSGSMKGKSLNLLQQSVMRFAHALFEFQPNAVLSITRFNFKSSELGIYKKENLQQLEETISNLSAHSSTHLYEAIDQKINPLYLSSEHNNILVLTDGEDSTGVESALRKQIDILQKNELVRTKNRLFLISYAQKQPEILHELTALFGSSIIDAKTTDFLKALSDEKKMRELIVARDLFTCRLTIEGKKHSYQLPVSMGGQVHALKPVILKQGETFDIKVIDSAGQLLLQDAYSAPKKTIDAFDNTAFYNQEHTRLESESLLQLPKDTCPNPCFLQKLWQTACSRANNSTSYTVECMLHFAKWVAKENETYFPQCYVADKGYWTNNPSAFFSQATNRVTNQTLPTISASPSPNLL